MPDSGWEIPENNSDAAFEVRLKGGNSQNPKFIN